MFYNYIAKISKDDALVIKGFITNDQIYTNVSPHDQNDNGQTLTLKVDQTFSLKSRNYAWDSQFEGQWNWSALFFIEGVWSYDKQSRTITLTTTKFHASLDSPVENEAAVLDKGFPNRVVSTPNFDLETSKDIRCFVVSWNYGDFSKVV